MVEERRKKLNSNQNKSLVGRNDFFKELGSWKQDHLLNLSKGHHFM